MPGRTTRGVHPVAQVFPTLSADELDELAADIKERGLLHPIVLDAKGRVLDGRNRLEACKRAEVEPRFEDYEGDDPIGFAVAQNLKRRHLTAGQRAAVGAEIEPLYAKEAKKRQREGAARGGAKKAAKDAGQKVPAGLREPSMPKHETTAAAQAAKAVGTSARAISQYKRVTNAAPDLAEKVKAGTMALDRAERIVRDREAERRRIEQARQEAQAQPLELRVDLRHGDFTDALADLTDIDAIITDPPYGAEFLPLLENLAIWADKVLAPDGVLAVLMGQTHLPHVFRLLDGYRAYRWTACYLTTGPAYVSRSARLQSQWKPLLVYGGGPRFSDVIRSEGSDADAKNHHRWGQDYGAFHTIVERLTEPGQTVADPFMGSGTTLLAAHALGRHVIGCDVDADAVHTARERVGGDS